MKFSVKSEQYFFSSQNVIGFIDSDKPFSIERHTFQLMPRFVPIIPIVKLAKNWVLLENLAHIERQTVF